jgi:hypothetical protein
MSISLASLVLIALCAGGTTAEDVPVSSWRFSPYIRPLGRENFVGIFEFVAVS